MTPIATHKYEHDSGRFTSQSIDIVVGLPLFKL